MKGLIRNNFYMLGSGLTLTFVFSALGVIVSAVLGALSENSGQLISGIIGAQLGGFGALAGTAMLKDAICKWNKFELTMPVSRGDVIKARYISYIIFILMGLLMAALSVFGLSLTAESVDMERVGFGFTFGLAFGLSLPTFMSPLALIFGADKNDILLFISVFLSLGLFIGSSAALTPILNETSDPNFVFRLGYFVFSIILFGISFLVSLKIYKKKEL